MLDTEFHACDVITLLQACTGGEKRGVWASVALDRQPKQKQTLEAVGLETYAPPGAEEPPPTLAAAL